MSEKQWAREVVWTVEQDDRKRTPRYRHSCHQCGTVVVTFSKGAAPREVWLHERKHQTMHAIQEAERELDLQPCDNCGETDDHTCVIDGVEYGPFVR